MGERSEDQRPPSHGELPYNPQDWNRRLAEARARRAATLRQRGQLRAVPAPTEQLAAAWDGERDGLAFVTRPMADVPVETEAAAPHPEPAAPPARSRRRHALTLLVGCVIGASLTGLVFLLSGAEPRPDFAQPAAGTLMATAPAEPTVEPPDTGPAVAEPPVAEPAIAAPPPPETVDPTPTVRTARTDLAFPVPEQATPLEPAEAPAAIVPAPSGRTPAAGPMRELAAPDMVNAPQLLSPTRDAPVAPVDRVVVLAPSSVSSAGRSEVVEVLREAGWPADTPGTAPFTISTTHVRFYHASDRAGAEDLATLLSAEARDFTDYSPSPPAGRIELWLAGRAPGTAAPARSASNPIFRIIDRIDAALDRLD